jgi:hypothetical protein
MPYGKYTGILDLLVNIKLYYLLATQTEREREAEKWVAVRITAMGGRYNNLSSVLKVPRQCPLVLPVRVKHISSQRSSVASYG